MSDFDPLAVTDFHTKEEVDTEALKFVNEIDTVTSGMSTSVDESWCTIYKLGGSQNRWRMDFHWGLTGQKPLGSGTYEITLAFLKAVARVITGDLKAAK